MASRNIRRVSIRLSSMENAFRSAVVGPKYMPVPTTVTLETAHKKRPT